VPPLHFSNFDTREIGVDREHGTYAEVAIDTCKICGSYWLVYRFEYEHLTGSGRWYRGIVSKEIAETATPATAIETLEQLAWWLYGGSYFESRGARRNAPLRIEI
jgi:hypothetical protein